MVARPLTTYRLHPYIEGGEMQICVIIRNFIIIERTANIEYRVNSDKCVEIDPVQVTVLKTIGGCVVVAWQLQQLWRRCVPPHLCKFIQIISHFLIQKKVFWQTGSVVA